MSAADILDFAARELHVWLDAAKPKAALLHDLYKLGIVEEAAG